MKKVLIILLVIAVIAGIGGVAINSMTKNFETYINNLVIEEVDLSSVGDGIYTGYSDSGVVKVRVEVIVKNHRFESIKILEHKNGKGKDAESIINDIIKEQRITVDVISGATYSSLIIQDALQKAFAN